ncbi:MAG: glycosyltransferase [Flavobacteriales bacterium]|nr:glycosyltransferase [Flavobacteriales bacterium]
MRPTLAIVAPCFNEGGAVLPFLEEMDRVLSPLPERSLIILVDDGSLDDTRAKALSFTPSSGNIALEVIALPYTMGHQEAIYQGLLHASETSATRFVVLDSDGEDDPQAIPEMRAHGTASVVFVSRGKRSESVGFRLGYLLYRGVFRMVAGRPITFGNYSMIDRRVLGAVLDRSFVHYAAFLSKQRVTTHFVRSDRRKRFDGVSKMGLDDLTLHAFRSLIEYSDRVLAMFLKAALYLSLVFLLSVLTIVGIKLFTDLAIPGWASNLSATMFNSMLLCVGFFVIGLMLSRVTQHRERTGRKLYERVEKG